MKRPNSTTLRRGAEFMGPENIEKELKKIREELAWMRTEQKEIECWIHVALRDLGRLPRPEQSRHVCWEKGVAILVAHARRVRIVAARP